MTRIEHEKQVIGLMIRLYCQKKEGNKELCPECKALLEYADKRLEHCKFGERKTTCRLCPVHCYKPDMRQRMRDVMRWAGPRMILYNPMEVIKHTIRELLYKKR